MDGVKQGRLDKRGRRRARREAQHGPERMIVRTVGTAHVLSCGHQVAVLETERFSIERRRCRRCLDARTRWSALLNERLGDIGGDGLPYFCERCGASGSVAPVSNVAGVRGECRECGFLVFEKEKASETIRSVE